MKFSQGKPIFQQIALAIEDRIVRGDLKPDERIPAVRDLALELEVNPNTVVKSFTDLEADGVIYKKRGLGYFVAAHAAESILKNRRRDFLQSEVPALFASMTLLQIEPETLIDLCKKHFASKKS